MQTSKKKKERRRKTWPSMPKQRSSVRVWEYGFGYFPKYFSC